MDLVMRFFFFFFIWLVRDAANNSHNAIARLCWFLYGILWCKKTPASFFVFQNSSCQQVVVVTRDDFSAHTQSACSAQTGHRCYNTRPVGSKLCRICTSLLDADRMLNMDYARGGLHRCPAFSQSRFSSVVLCLSAASWRLSARFTCRELYRVFPPRSALLRRDRNRISWLSFHNDWLT